MLSWIGHPNLISKSLSRLKARFHLIGCIKIALEPCVHSAKHKHSCSSSFIGSILILISFIFILKLAQVAEMIILLLANIVY